MPQYNHRHVRDADLRKERVVTLDTACAQPIQPPMSADTAGTAQPHRTVMFSPPLPALSRDEPVENPFRPDGNLAHQVEPIVEAYKTKGGGSDYADSQHSTPMKAATAAAAPPAKESTPSKLGSLFSKRRHSKEEGQNNTVRPSDVHVQTQQEQVVDVKRTTIASPKAGHVELVHMDDENTDKSDPNADPKQRTKKKKCGCCSVQ